MALLLLPAAAAAAGERIVVASKAFTESRLLAEIMALLIEARTEVPVERRHGLQGTKVCHEAILAGQVDLYPEYTGTALVAILGVKEPLRDPRAVLQRVRRAYRDRFRLVWLEPFGFSNSYALAVPEEKAREWKLRAISDLVPYRDRLRLGFSHEFLNRPDGWPALSAAYGLKGGEVRGMEHGLAYQAVGEGRIDVIDAYTTDGKLLRYRLQVLQDDRRFFPPYHAAPVVRLDTLERHPQLREILGELAGTLPEERMQRLNYQVEEEGRDFRQVAAGFLREAGLARVEVADTVPRRANFFVFLASRWKQTLVLVEEHLFLTAVSVFLAVLVAVPLGIAITRYPPAAPPVLGIAGVIQTIPGIALLAFMLPFLGLGEKPAIVALFLYALLPIVRNTYTGIQEVDPALTEAARGMGLHKRQILFMVELPLATRTIMGGIRTSAVINVGVATLAAFIGAGGLGEPIVTGLQLNDTSLVLAGAVPAALLAILVDWALGRVEARLAPRGVG